MRGRAQDAMADVLLDTPGVCSDAEAVREAPSLQCAWEGALDYELDPRLWWWFAAAFLPPEEVRRIHRACDGVREFFLDLGRLHLAKTGQAVPLPEGLIRALQMRLVVLLRPSAYQVATGAKVAPFERASRILARLTKESEWRTRS